MREGLTKTYKYRAPIAVAVFLGITAALGLVFRDHWWYRVDATCSGPQSTVRAYKKLWESEYILEVGQQVYMVDVLRRRVLVSVPLDARCVLVVGQLRPAGVTMDRGKVGIDPQLEVESDSLTFTGIDGQRMYIRIAVW